MNERIGTHGLDDSNAHGATFERAAPRKTSPALIAVLVLTGVGLAGWIGVRVSSATAKQKEVAASRDEAARIAVANAQKAAVYDVVKPVPAPWQPVISFEGSIVPKNEADLGFKTPGRVASLSAKLGDRVAAGQVLASLDASEASSQAGAAEAQVRAAEAQLALATDGERRTAAMVASGSQAEASGVQAAKQKDLALANLEAARAQLSLAKASVGNHALVAPFAGTVSKAPTGTGAVVNPGVPLFHIYDLSTLKLVGTINELDASLVKVGSEVTVQALGRQAKGKVTVVLGAVDPATRRVPIEAEVQNPPDGPLLANTFARATVRGGSTITVLSVPPSALRPGSQDEVFALSGTTLKSRRIQFVTADNGTLLVRNGIEPSDEIVLGPTAEAKDGDVIEVRRGNANAPAAPTPNAPAPTPPGTKAEAKP